jgi:nitrogen fixation NifU-like protein
MDHFTNPRNMGEMEEPNATAEAGNPVCGDVMRLYLEIRNNRIVDAKFKTFGCSAAIAASSMTTVLLKDKSIEEALLITNETVGEALGGLPPAKQHCSVLAEEVIRAAIEDYRNRCP